MRKADFLAMLVLMLLVLGGSLEKAWAVPITFDFSGKLTGGSALGSISGIHVGTRFTGTFTFDTVGVNLTSPGPGLLETYKFLGPPYGLTLSVFGASSTLRVQHVRLGFQILGNDPNLATRTQYNVSSLPSPRASLASPSVLLTFSNFNPVSLVQTGNNNALPLSAPNLLNQPLNSMFLSLGRTQGLVARTFDHIAPIPEPTTALLLGTGLAGLGLWRYPKHVNS